MRVQRIKATWLAFNPRPAHPQASSKTLPRTNFSAVNVVRNNIENGKISDSDNGVDITLLNYLQIYPILIKKNLVTAQAQIKYSFSLSNKSL
ncbi:hypothetical protein [Calothrix sp. PCC 6303]|uniref:hypothetical protein n=1 Tax=Calothrix sp. PCC 6303 TaxID=1170562 RepID=UPI0002A004F1|nr:hypothetical protein [Calothrix sp. PCC 6303]AFZ04519.1 hypothetical protein Cal6303_5643 [Calothrix sp. PCC 6303]